MEAAPPIAGGIPVQVVSNDDLEERPPKLLVCVYLFHMKRNSKVQIR